MFPANAKTSDQLTAQRRERSNGVRYPSDAAIKRFLAIIWAGIAASGLLAMTPGNDPVAVVRLLANQDAAVLRVGERLAVSSAALCGNSTPSAGMAVQQLSQYGAEYRSAARTVLGITDRPTVALVTAGGAAEAGGVRPGDVIAAIEDHAFDDTPPRKKSGEFAEIAAVHDIIDKALADGRTQLSLIRGGQPLSLVIMPRTACRARFDVRAGRRNNASADGTYVQVSSDLVGQTRGDGELAAILAHELAHDILDHRKRLRAEGRRPAIRATEIEADRLSVYLLDAAGYPVADAIAFWSRWGPANDLGIFSDRTHPGWKKRIASIEAEAELIAAAKVTGGVVMPPTDLRRPD